MLTAYMIGLLPDGEAFYSDSNLPLEAQKAASLPWAECDLLKVYAVVGNEITDITAAYCKMWMNKADLSDITKESDFPMVIRDNVPELVSEALAEWAEEARGQSQLRSDYRASVL